MKKLVAVLLMSIFSVAAFAETGKVAVVNYEAALFNSNIAKASFKKVEEQFADDIKKGEELQKELESMQQKMQKDGAIMSDDEKNQLQLDAANARKDLEYHAGKLQQAQQTWRQQVSRRAAPLVQKLIQEIGEEKGFDLILNASAVVYMNSATDVTQLLLDKLNAFAAEQQKNAAKGE